MVVRTFREHRVRLALCLLAIAALVVAGCGGTGSPKPSGSSSTTPAHGQWTVGMLPKTTADPFFVAAHQGAEEAAKELGMKVVYNGPATLDVAGQAQIIGQWAQQHLDAITVSANDPNALVPALKQAAAAGVKVSAWNADVAPGARQYFMNNPTPEALGSTLADEVVHSTGPKVKVLVITSTLTAPNQNSWLRALQAYVAQRYPGFQIQKVLPGQADTATSYNVAKEWLQAHPETQAILTLDGSALAGAAKAVDSLGKRGKIVLTGIGVPSQNGKDILSGTVKSAVLWSPVDLGYATMYMVHAQLTGQLRVGQRTLQAGRLGTLQFGAPDTILLGKPLVFTKANVQNYHF